jgi:hypothetical protein
MISQAWRESHVIEIPLWTRDRRRVRRARAGRPKIILCRRRGGYCHPICRSPAWRRSGVMKFVIFSDVASGPKARGTFA